jgi:hypothetical protein
LTPFVRGPLVFKGVRIRDPLRVAGFLKGSDVGLSVSPAVNKNIIRLEKVIAYPVPLGYLYIFRVSMFIQGQV